MAREFLQVWFQNRRARLKKNQQKLDDHQSFERDDQPQYDSEIHLVRKTNYKIQIDTFSIKIFTDYNQFID